MNADKAINSATSDVTRRVADIETCDATAELTCEATRSATTRDETSNATWLSTDEATEDAIRSYTGYLY